MRVSYNLEQIISSFLSWLCMMACFINFINMAVELNGSSYYRANPFYQQGYIPDGAFKNRKAPAFIVQIPQGNQYFQPTNKKHFQRVGYYSTIAEEGIINNDLIDSRAREKQYFRSLNVEDIEGASTNTLISQAVKNKLKAKQQLLQRQREQQELQARQKKQFFQRKADQSKRMEALGKMNRRDEPNYHEKVLKLRTQESQRKLSPVLKLPQIAQNQNYHLDKYQKFKSELQRTENEIKQLQKQLSQGGPTANNDYKYQYQSLPSKQGQSQTTKEQNDPKYIRDYERDLVKPQIKYQNQRSFSNQNNTPLNHYAQINPTRFSHQDSAEDLSEIKNLGLYQENKHYSHPHNNHNPQTSFQINRQRSYTDKLPTYPDQKNNPFYPNNQEEISEPQVQRVGNQPPVGSSRVQLAKQTREEHRRFNPTYLSFGSPAIGLAGRNIVGYRP